MFWRTEMKHKGGMYFGGFYNLLLMISLSYRKICGGGEKCDENPDSLTS